MNIFASDILFYIFGALAVILSLMVVFMRNPVSSAMMMALSFGATAAIMIGLGAHFLGILQILVYAGAIMVLFAFIIMLLNVKRETSPFRRPVSVAIGVIIAALFLGQLIGIIYSLPGAKETHRCPMATAEQAWNDLKIGQDAPENGAAHSTACEQGFNPSNYCVTGEQPDKLVRPHSPSVVLPSISPQCSAHLYPEGTTIRAEIDNGEFPDTALLGRTLFDKYNRSLVIAGLALLVASIGVVVLSRRPSGK
ncbi:NADH-quinone oxidoreductase subunit J [Akkermansia muciniphila]|uniref:NADH-quinone oxidoreductase subunit J n=1 Tax=Akkermansia muciniphila TaxID=239935 RepID=UPI001BFEECDC|nr:NADH-quinone oxidoreductase subunit J [Akkermansia muciniphila]MBT8778763.1 hypothetical protein [Akkermansia muciniphila]